MERTRKTWGSKWNIFQNDLCEVSILKLEPHQRCSWHRHKAKSNLFFVISGQLFIKTEWGVEELNENEVFTTHPGELHEFQTRERPANIIEVMYVQYNAEDIQREVLGGPIK